MREVERPFCVEVIEMLDLRVLRNEWTDEGAREVFATLVTQCVLSVYPNAQAVRPDPGDEGLDTFVGRFDGDVRVYQAKYFCNEIGDSQRRGIRDSWNACRLSDSYETPVLWTLCIPIEMSVEEHRWWQGWARRQTQRTGIPIDLWAKSRFVGFSSQPALRPVFDLAFRRISMESGTGDYRAVCAAMKARRVIRALEQLPTPEHFRGATFVRKLELAGVTAHRAARTAFYNFELLRTAVEQGGTGDEQGELTDLQLRILDLWEGAYHEHAPDRLGQTFVGTVEARINAEDQARLRSWLPADAVHKKGGLHNWADLCEVGWTIDHADAGREVES